jgi:uncharacterized protein YunC (DUF1805 family)
MPNVCINSVPSNNKTTLGVMASWEGSQYVMIIAKKGIVSCGFVDREIMEEHDTAIAISKGTKENPLITVDDLLKSKISDLTKKAGDLGIELGMTGQQALDILTR